VVVINPTSTAYSAVNITLKNPGITSAAGEVYVLNSLHGQISSQPVSLNSTAGGYSAEVEVPAYSTVALSVKGVQEGSAPKAVLTVTPQSGSHPLTVLIDSSQSQGGGSYIIGRTIDFGDGKWLSWVPTTSYTYNMAGNYTVRVRVKNQSGQISSATSVVTVH
jgi:PKD repeat protein